MLIISFSHFSKVSWVRHKDVQILSVGGRIFTSDPRFSSIHSEDEGRYTLVIKRVRPDDQGTYECQISTKPTMSIFIRLFITSEFCRRSFQLQKAFVSVRVFSSPLKMNCSTRLKVVDLLLLKYGGVGRVRRKPSASWHMHN